jgi:HPt (histidine-containing phosphotransfer) domain-containing protein
VSGEPTLDPAAFERLLEITGGDVAFVDELIDTYLEDAVVQLGTMAEAAATGDADALVRPAHSLKSNSDNVGAVALTVLCRAVETDARAGAVADPTERVAAIQREFEAVRAGLLGARAAR